MHLPAIQPTKHCGECAQFERSYLEKHGYCKSGRDFEARARLLPADTVCLFLNEWSVK